MIREHRPWGYYQVLYENEQCKIKKITVKPGQRLSLQSHQKRRETWQIISGNAQVWVGDVTEALLSKDSVIIIEKNKIHRIGNPSDKEDLVFIEIQTGEYFGEDDIIRYEDDYNRIKEETK